MYKVQKVNFKLMTNLYEKGEKVQVDLPGILQEKMIVIDVQFNNGGWHYELASLNKDGSTNKRKVHKVVCEEGLKKVS